MQLLYYLIFFELIPIIPFTPPTPNAGTLKRIRWDAISPWSCPPVIGNTSPLREPGGMHSDLASQILTDPVTTPIVEPNVGDGRVGDTWPCRTPTGRIFKGERG